MGKQIKKVCKHEPGKQWTDGCCSQNPGVETTSGKSSERVDTFKPLPRQHTS